MLAIRADQTCSGRSIGEFGSVLVTDNVGCTEIPLHNALLSTVQYSRSRIRILLAIEHTKCRMLPVARWLASELAFSLPLLLHVLSLASSITRNASVPFHPCYCVPSARDHGTCQHNYDCRHECCIACNTELDDSSNRNLISSFQPRCEWFFFICFFCLLPYLY